MAIKRSLKRAAEAASIKDVAQYILSKIGGTSTWKLQKLVYYAQAWHAVWEDEPLFNARIEAWANGPVCLDLYNGHRGQFVISTVHGGDAGRLTRNQKESIDVVVKHYAQYSGQQLSDLTHRERPWLDARAGLAPGERGSKEITVEAMVEYYSSLPRRA